MDSSIFREPTEDEKKDYKPIGEKDLQSEFRKRLVEEEQKSVRDHKPFCYRCAKLDYNDKIDTLLKEMTRDHSKRKISINDLRIELKPYAEEKRFTLVDKKEVREDKLIDNIRTNVITGYNYAYKCNTRGCGRTVFVPIDREGKKPNAV